MARSSKNAPTRCGRAAASRRAALRRRRRCSGSWSRSIRRPRPGKGADACGLVAAGRAEDGTIYVIADETVAGLSPAGWSRRAIALWRRLAADALVVEVNQGGDMVRAVIGEADPDRAGDRGARAQGQMAARRAGRGACTSRAA